MNFKADDNPFQAGTGHIPAVLAGRDDEIERLALVINRIGGDRKDGGKLAKLPFPPVKIVGPRGVGKTALLNWAKAQAEARQMRFVTCEDLKEDQSQSSMQALLERMAGKMKSMLSHIKSFQLSVVEQAGVGVEFRKIESIYTKVAAAAVKKGPLLLLMDEVHHYDLPLLRAVLQGSQKLIGEGYPLGLVLAGTPGLNSHLAKAEATFIVRSQNIYINTLSDKAARAALSEPLRAKGVKFTPSALKAMAVMADNYPFFIQLVGQEVWYEMVKAGRGEIDDELVKRIEKKARRGRIEIYTEAYDRILRSDFLPQARQVMKLLEGKGGKMDKHALISALAKANRGMKDSQAEQIFVSLSEDGFIWTVEDETTPGIPSFFDYFKAKQKK